MCFYLKHCFFAFQVIFFSLCSQVSLLSPLFGLLYTTENPRQFLPWLKFRPWKASVFYYRNIVLNNVSSTSCYNLWFSGTQVTIPCFLNSSPILNCRQMFFHYTYDLHVTEIPSLADKCFCSYLRLVYTTKSLR